MKSVEMWAKFSDRGFNGLLLVLVFGLPLVFWPSFNDVYGLSKVIFLAVGVSLLLVLWLLGQVLTSRMRVTITPLSLPVAIFAIAVLISTLVQSPNVAGAFMGRTTVITAGAVLFYLVAGQGRKIREQVLGAVVAVSTVLSFIGIGQFLNLGQSLGFLPTLVRNRGWSPTGSLFSLEMFLVLGLAVTLALAGYGRSAVKIGGYLVAAVQVVAIIVVGSMLLPGKEFALKLLPWSAGYSIAVDTLKTVRTAALGVGPENYLAAFTAFKPVNLNQTGVWNLRFGNSSNEVFQVLTTVGLLGLLGLGFLVWRVISVAISPAASRLAKVLLVPLVVMGAIAVLVPFSIEVWFLTFLILGVWAGEVGREKQWVWQEPLLGLFLMVLPVGLLSTTIYLGGRAARGDLAFARSLVAAATNKGKETYEAQIAAIAANPYKTSYRVVYSQTNLVLANSLAGQKNLSDADKQTVTTLVQQAIREGKTAVALDRTNVGVWENLAGIYRWLINFAQGADQFAVQSYQQALALDPRNPGLWLDYGGLYYALGQYDEAEVAFRQVVALKPDFANGRYNLAKAYEQQKNYAKAAQEMALVVSLVEPGSADAKKAQEELDGLNAKIPQAQQAKEGQPTEQQLSEPKPAPSKAPGLEEIKLPKESAPEVSITPSPFSSPSPTLQQ